MPFRVPALCLLALGAVIVFSASSTTRILQNGGLSDSAFYLKRTLLFGGVGLVIMFLVARNGLVAHRDLTARRDLAVGRARRACDRHPSTRAAGATADRRPPLPRRRSGARPA